MPTTRSASKKQKSLEDYGLEKDVRSNATKSASPKTDEPQSKDPGSTDSAQKRKRTAVSHERASKVSKLTERGTNPTKQTQLANDGADLEEPIMINRAPVLTLWAATVANFLYPDEDWTTCLGIGSSVSSLCAISKGRAIGKVQPKDESTKSEEQKKKAKRQTKDETRELEVMGFPMHIKDGVVVVDGKKKPANEHLLQTKYGGEEEYTNVRRAMEQALQTWNNDKEELDKKAFHMYEKFRPNIASGSAGWGRKGPLNLHQVKSTIESKH